jgi:predicted metal-dependent phosphoesterase TrpH
VTILNEQDQDAHSRHDPNETPDQISEDDLTAYAPQDEDEARRTARRRKNERRAQRRVQAAEHAHVNPHDLNQDFDNAADPIFAKMDRIIQLTRKVVTQLERQNSLSSIRGTASRAATSATPQASRTPGGHRRRQQQQQQQ